MKRVLVAAGVALTLLAACGGDGGYWIHDGPHWSLVIDDGDNRGTVSVDEGTYGRVENGDWFDSETGETTGGPR